MGLLKLVAKQVKIGQALPFSIRDEQGKLLLAAGQMVTSEAQLETLLARGITVDEAEFEASGQQIAGTASESRRLTLFDLWEQAAHRLERLLSSLTDEAEVAKAAVNMDRFSVDFIALVQRDADIAIYLAVRQDQRRLRLYGFTHALHTALICMLMASRLGWDGSRQQRLVKAALTMNLSIVGLQGHMATHGGTLTDSQREQMLAHPEHAGEALRAAGIDDDEWLRAVVEHHERSDGGGYPKGMREPSEYATALRLADVFMAKISTRVDRPALAIREAARQMFQDSGGSPLASAIVKEIGLYPPGDFVQLASGEMAVVIRRGDDARTPLVAAITDRSGLPMVNTIQRDTRQPTHAITGAAADPKIVVRVPPERLYGLT